MPYPKIFSEEIEEKYRLTATLYEMENAMIAFFNKKGRMRLGTLAVAIPRFGGISRCISSVILGDKNIAITKILAEHLAATFDKIALVSIHVNDVMEREADPVLLKLLKSLLEKIEV